ncbi:hypothetical protein NIES4071_27300 [Calothrix sp. NIES-4071]|nr:hypothetical protein NIES4071_27300 [Calothrix sp. NIES-4071]BAZ57052.1 hypothetical protein NIES4105_27240 [Calothrix sp. NIES-4105]
MESTFLKGKSILLISPKFFGYELAVEKKLSQLGADVTFVDDRPNNGLLDKGLIRIDKRLLKIKIDKYYAKISSYIAHKEFDIIFLLNPEALPISFLQTCKSRWENALCVMYMWDSINNRKHTLEFVPFCNRVFTFDMDDAARFNFFFKPLFYLDDYLSIRQGKHAIKYDISFMGTLHSDRYAIAKEVKDWCSQQGLRCFFYFFMQSQVLYYFNKLRGKGISLAKSKVSFAKLSTSEVVEIVASSRVILDIQHPKQTGLTMRTLETLGAGKKLITTNDKVQEYDFYQRENVAIINRFNPTHNLDLSFFLNSTKEVPKQVIMKYYIGSWLLDILKS